MLETNSIQVEKVVSRRNTVGNNTISRVDEKS